MHSGYSRDPSSSSVTLISMVLLALRPLLLTRPAVRRAAGLEDITIFEKQDKWGGKTRTHYYKAPGFPEEAKVAAEMGTCYLSNT